MIKLEVTNGNEVLDKRFRSGYKAINFNAFLIIITIIVMVITLYDYI